MFLEKNQRTCPFIREVRVNKKGRRGCALKIADFGIAFRGSEPDIIWCKRKRTKYKRGAEGQVH